MKFAPVQVEGAPPAWIAAEHPFTFVITETGIRQYAASVMDAETLVRLGLGTDFLTLGAAEEACRDFVQSRRPS